MPISIGDTRRSMESPSQKRKELEREIQYTAEALRIALGSWCVPRYRADGIRRLCVRLNELLAAEAAK